MSHSLHCTAESNPTLWNNDIPIKKEISSNTSIWWNLLLSLVSQKGYVSDMSLITQLWCLPSPACYLLLENPKVVHLPCEEKFSFFSTSFLAEPTPSWDPRIAEVNSFHNLPSLEAANKIVLYHMHGGESQFMEIWYMNQGQDSLSVNLNLNVFFFFLISFPKSYGPCIGNQK